MSSLLVYEGLGPRRTGEIYSATLAVILGIVWINLLKAKSLSLRAHQVLISSDKGIVVHLMVSVLDQKVLKKFTYNCNFYSAN